MRRITLDWDFKNKRKVKRYLMRIMRFEPKSIRIEETKKGYHVFIWCVNRRCSSQKEKYLLRKYFGDDLKHLAMDKLHKFGKQTLFHKKIKLR